MEGRLDIEQVKQFARLAPWAMVGTTVNATIVAFVFRHQLPALLLLSWLAAVFLITAIRLPLFLRSAGLKPEVAEAKRYGWWLRAAAGAGGLLWGGAGLFFFPLLTSEHQVFLAFVLGGMVAGAAATYSVLLSAFLAFAIPALLPIMIRFFLLPGELETAMGFLVLIYLCLMIPIARQINLTMLNNFRLRFRNEELLAVQAAARREAERINLELRREIVQRRKIEQDLQQSRSELELRVATRTRELAEANLKMQVDINERKKAEQLLRETNELLERVFSISFMKIAYLDRDFNFIRVNQAFAEPEGKNPTYFIGKNHFELYPSPENEKIFRQVTTTGRKISFRAKPFVRPNHPEQEVTCWDWELIPLPGETGQVQGLALFLVDVTEQVRTEASLRQSQKMEAIGTLAGGIAHDFNNILNVILGYTELAQRDLPPDSPAALRLTKVISASQRAADLIRQILEFSSASGQERLPLQLQQEIEETAIILEGMRPANVTLRTEIDPGCRPVLANGSQIHQVLMNLGVNGFHAMRENGGILTFSLKEIALSTEQGQDRDLPPGSYARITVADTGPGMDRETQARIFDPYFTTKEMGEGSGMGLAIVHGIVKSHKGAIRVRSGPATGSFFEVLLPILPIKKTEAEISGTSKFSGEVRPSSELR